MEIPYDLAKEYIGHEFRKSVVEMEYRITAKPRTLRNTTSNAILKNIQHVLGNLGQNYNITQTYVDEDDPWLGISVAAEFAACSTKNRLKCYSPGQLVLVRDMIILIKHKVEWELIHHQKLKQINKDNIR